LRSFTSTSPHSNVTITHSQQNGDSRRVQQWNGNLFGTNAWPKVMLARINLLQIHYRHRYARLPKKTPWLQNRLGLATFPKQIRLYARSLNRHLGTILCTNYRKRHQSVRSFLTNNFGRQQMHSTRCADTISGSTFKSIRFL